MATQQRNKGQAGMGGRGKNQVKGRQDQATRRRQRKTGGGVTLSKPSDNPKQNQGRNQEEWEKARKMNSRY
jgi:hypothetical protein